MFVKIDAGADVKNYNSTVRVTDKKYQYTKTSFNDFVALPDYSDRFLLPNYYSGCGPDCTGEAP
jgi:hypothetical protein